MCARVRVHAGRARVCLCVAVGLAPPLGAGGEGRAATREIKGRATGCEGFDFGASPGPVEGFVRVVLLVWAAAVHLIKF